MNSFIITSKKKEEKIAQLDVPMATVSAQVVTDSPGAT
jgi:hypothetical protein